MVRTEVGTKCERCARPVAPKVTHVPRSRLPWVAGLGGAVLVIGALVVISLRSSNSPAAPPPHPVVGSWAKDASLTAIRGTTAVVQLRDGRVLAAGGGVGALPLAATEVYDPATKAWTATGAMTQARRGAAAVVLGDGRVLVAGGVAGPTLLPTAEIFDPGTGKWAPTGSMAVARLGGTLTLLPGGRVLAAGGTTDTGQSGSGAGQTISPSATAEIFDPGSGKWAPTGSMAAGRFEATATALNDGRVLIVGGLGGAAVASQGGGVQYGPLKTAEIYDHAVGAFTGAGGMLEGRALHVAVKLSTGDVLVAGGVGGNDGTVTLSSVERFNPTTGAWSQAAAMAQGRTGASAAVLNNGYVLVTGGETVDQGTRHSLATSQVFDPPKNAWYPGGNMSCPRSGQGSTLLKDGSVLVVAGDTAFPGQPPVAQGCVDRYNP